MLVALLAVKVAGVPPKLTALVPVKFVPVTITDVPLNPTFGLTLVTVGAGGTVYVYSSAELVRLEPPGVVTLTSTVPVPPGTVA